MRTTFRRRQEIWDLCEAYFASVTTRKRSGPKMRKQMDEFFAEATPEELHVFVSSWNWDGGIGRIRQVIEHPDCDAGTALKAYWLASPEYYLKYASRDEMHSYEQESFDLICDIERRYLAGEYKTADLSYRPKRKKPQPDWKRSLPDEMYQPVGKGPWWAFWRR